MKNTDHPILRKLISIFAPGYNLSKNPPKGVQKKRKSTAPKEPAQGFISSGRFTA